MKSAHLKNIWLLLKDSAIAWDDDNVGQQGAALSFFTVFFSVVFWSSILGSLGAILSIPLTLAFKVLVLEGDESGRWFFDLISDKKKTEKSQESTHKKPYIT